MTQLPRTKPPPNLTPAVLVASPTRSQPVPNASGTLAVYTELFPATEDTPIAKGGIWVLDLNSTRSWPIPRTPSARFPQWLGRSDQVIWLEACPDGHTRFVVADARLRGERYVAGTVAGPVWDLRTTRVVNMGDPADDVDDDLGFAIVGEVDGDGRLFNPLEGGRSLKDTAGGPGICHRPGHVHCRQEMGHRRIVIWFGSLVRPPTDSPRGRYTIPRVTNLMAYFDLGNVSLQSQSDEKGQEIRPDFVISSWVILFTAQDPEVDSATHTVSSCYICPMLDWSGLLVPGDYYKAFRHRGLGGACSSPAVSNRGQVGFLAQKQDGFAADKNRIIIVTDNQRGLYEEIFASADGKGQWDLSPSRVSFAADGRLLLSVEEKGRKVLYQLDPVDGATPADLKRIAPSASSAKSVVYATPLGDSPLRFLLTCESFVQPPQFILHDLVAGAIAEFPLDNPRFGLSKDQIKEVWFLSANNRKIHAWVIKPLFFNPEHKYPLAYFIQDSQHGSWSSIWSTSTTTSPNLAFFAEQGYVVVAPNITGSIGYGEDFVNGTQHSPTDTAYQDLHHGFKYIQNELPYIDSRRAVALGCGYGGYMVNWIQGHDLGRRFRALVSCNGIFSIMTYLSADVQHPVFHELGGPPWLAAEEWRRADPARHLHNWKTPQMVIYDPVDVQIRVSDALAAVKTLRLREVECEFLDLEASWGHMNRPERQVLFYYTLLNWMARYTK
ncbi:Alpha/Beta hydrolase protein [Aspergillus pseudoustus]|uniref:Dipeptidyl-peptidase V n=1 Tax=Aspergillus pseudoustus TaxID=1810923 RepID=A0ABR4JYR2_9EURO